MSNFPDSLPAGFQPRDVKPRRIEQDHFDEFDPSRHVVCAVGVPSYVVQACEAVAKHHGLCLPDVITTLVERMIDDEEVMAKVLALYADRDYMADWAKMASATIRLVLERYADATPQEREEQLQVCCIQSLSAIVGVIYGRHLQLF